MLNNGHSPTPSADSVSNEPASVSGPAEMVPLPPVIQLGRMVATPAALQALDAAGVTPAQLLQRHQRGDWGDVSAGDQQRNECALLEGARLLSAYALPVTSARVWIITEADRSRTTLLLPEEY